MPVTVSKFKSIALLCALALLTGCIPAAHVTPQPTPQPTPSPTPSPTPAWEREGWTLVWQAEFEEETLNPADWAFDIGGHGWGNNEWQAYTQRPENIRLENGLLIIEARAESYVNRDYTSARIKTQGLHAWTYGRFEGRMKLPYGQGIWPAFWMLGEDIQSAGWPRAGEIDIMEHIGREPDRIYATVHGPGYSGGAGVGHYTTLPIGAVSDDFHVYAIEWEPEEIRWYLDDMQYFKITPASVPGTWVYDHPFFLILNLAVGGNWPGYPNASTVFPQFLEVDYVRVYQRPDAASTYTRQRGAMQLGDIQLRAQENADGTWQAIAAISVVDADGNPVAEAKVAGGWVGAIIRGEKEALTDATGTVTLHSQPSARRGEVTFCVTGVTRQGYTYNKAANARNCGKIETSK